MLESSSCGIDSEELDYALCKLDQLVSLCIRWQIISKDSLLEEVLDLLTDAYYILYTYTGYRMHPLYLQDYIYRIYTV